MDFSQNSLFGYMEDLQELTIIERPVRRSLKVRPGEEDAGRDWGQEEKGITEDEMAGWYH